MSVAGERKKLGIVIVVHGTQERLNRHLDALCDQTRMPDTVVIVDNGAGDLSWTAKMPFRVEVVPAGDVGPAGGFRTGAIHACRIGCDSVAFADDDAIPAPDAVERICAHLERGAGAVAGHYDNGSPIILANHYLAMSREALHDAGLHFAPFYLMSEDQEYFERVSRSCAIVRDPRIEVSHPFSMGYDSLRDYLSLRNFAVHMAISGSAAGFARYMVFHTLRCMFFALRFGMYESFLSVPRAILDFASLRMGRPSMQSRKAAFPPAEAPPGALAVGGARAQGAIETAAGFAFAARGRDILVSEPFYMAFPPYSALARDVYALEKGKTMHVMRNVPVVSLLFTAAALPAALLMLVPALAAFFLRRGRYRKMLEEQVSEDREAITPGTSFSRPRP
ncbi:MAG: glycosyltransferase [Candidatus Micrarchaeota archaeon]